MFRHNARLRKRRSPLTALPFFVELRSRPAKGIAPPGVKPWRAPRYCQAAYCDSDKGVRPVAHSQLASPGTAAPPETPPGYAAATARFTPRARLDATAPGYGQPRQAAQRRRGPGARGLHRSAARRPPRCLSFACTPVVGSTSAQAGLPAELKHITKRKKRN